MRRRVFFCYLLGVKGVPLESTRATLAAYLLTSLTSLFRRISRLGHVMDIDLDSVIDRLLEGELLSIDIMFIGGKRVW